MATTRKRTMRRAGGASARKGAKQSGSSLVNEKVLDHAVRSLRKDPDIKSNVLYDQAKAIDPSIGKLDRRVYHMRYAMRARRILKAEGRGSAPRAAAAASDSATRTPRKRGMRRMSAKGGRRAAANSGDYSERDRNMIRAVLTATMKEAVQAQSKEDLVALFDSIDSRTEQLLALTSK